MIIEPTCSNDVHFIFIRHKNFFLSSKITKYTYITRINNIYTLLVYCFRMISNKNNKNNNA